MRRAAVAAILSTLALTPFAAQAGSKTHERTRIVGYSAVASWDFTEGNIGTFVNVVVTENDESGTAGPSETAQVSLAISRFDLTTSNILMDGVAFIDGSDNFELVVDKQLGTATLRVRNAIFQDNNSFTFFDVDMDLTWTATADAFTGKSHFKEKVPGMKTNSMFHGTFRDGVASGSIVGRNIPTGTEPTIQFTPVPSNMAQLQFNKFGSHTVTTVTP